MHIGNTYSYLGTPNYRAGSLCSMCMYNLLKTSMCLKVVFMIDMFLSFLHTHRWTYLVLVTKLKVCEPHSMSLTWLLNWIKGWGIWNTPLVSQWRSSTVTLVKELVVRRLKVESWPSICWTHPGTISDTQLSRVWPKCVGSPWEPGVSATWGDASDIWGWKMKRFWSFTVWVTSAGHLLTTSS